MFERVEKTLFEIKNTLLNDQFIRNELYYASCGKDFEGEKVDINKNLVQDYITLFPLYDLNEDYSKNLWIQIVLDSCEKDEDNCITGMIRVNIVMNNTKWVHNNKIVPLSVTDRIVKLLDKIKFSISNTLQFDSIVPLAITKQITGYALVFSFVDGNAEPEEL